MRAAVIHARNPFDPFDREVRELRRPARVRQLAPRGTAPVIALINGRALRRAGWRRRLRDGDVLAFVSLPQGGGGHGGSNPMQALAMIALMAVAGPLATMLTGTTAAAATAAGAASWTSIAYSATQAGIQMAGSALINAMMPQARTSEKTPSPTYTLTAQGNAARIEAAIPVQYGRLLAYPDFAAQPYAEFAGGEQYLYQLLCLGCGEFEIEEIRIEDTPISNFAEITYEVIPPGGAVTLFPTSVVTSSEVSGQELAAFMDPVASWVRVGATITVTTPSDHSFAAGQAWRVDITSGGGVSDVYTIDTVPAADRFTITAPEVGTSGACTIHRVIGGIDGFVAAGAETVAHRLGIDMVLPSGLYRRDHDGKLRSHGVAFRVQARQVDDLGLPIGAWIDIAAASFSAKTVSPLRKSYFHDLAVPGRYRVRAWRNGESIDEENGADQILWSGLRSYMADPTDFGPVTLIAMRMRATSNLSLQSSRKIGVLATRKVPVWNGTSWSAPVATRSIAWALADAARNSDYGAGLTDARIDLAALLALDAIWAARGDTFNGRFDSSVSLWQALGQIAAVGRAKPFMQGGVLRVVRDGPQTVPVAHFGMHNIKAGSFAMDMIQTSEATADAVRVVYFDSRVWAEHTVKAALPGSAVAKPKKIKLFGVTDRDHAMREGLYLAACNKYRRTVVKFTTEMEGFIPVYGDLISVQHDMPGWGAAAEAVAWNPATRALRLSEPMDFSGGTHVIGMRRADGSLSGPWEVAAGADDYEVILATAPDITPETSGQDRERTHVTFGTSSTWRTLAKVLSCRPRSLYEVEIEAVAEDPSVHTAETGVVAPPIVTSDLPRRVVQPVVSGLFAKRIPGDAIGCVIGWRPAPGAEVYHVEMAEGDDVDDPDVEWTRVADVSNANYHAPSLLHALRSMIRVRGQGLAAGPWITATIGSLIPDFYLTDDTAFWLADETPFWSN